MLPEGRKVLLVCCSPAKIVSLARSDENTPVLKIVNANTEATITNAIRMIAVSRPVIPRCLVVIKFEF